MISSASQNGVPLEIEHAIKLCDRHLCETNSRGSDIEAYFTKYLLILICSNYENRIREMIIERVKKANDSELVSFVDKAKSTKEKIKSFIQKRIELVLNNKPFVEIFHDDGCLKMLKEKREKIIPNDFNIVSNIVEEGLAKGDIFADAAKPIILMILGVTYGSIYANMEIGVEWDYKKQINSAVNIIFNGIGKKIEKECE